MSITAAQIRQAAYRQLTGETLHDASLIAHVRTLEASERAQKRVSAIIAAAARRLAAQMQERIDGATLSGRDAGPFVTARVRKLHKSLMSLVNDWSVGTSSEFEEYLKESLKTLAISSADAARLAISYAVEMGTAHVPPDDAATSMRKYEQILDAGAINAGTNTARMRWSIASPQPHILESLASASPLKGHMMAEWISSWRAAVKFNIAAELTIGFAAGETPSAIAKRIRAAAGLSDVAARTLVRTSFSAVSANAREMLFAENLDIIKEVIWVSKLDSHTTPICRALDNKRFPVGSGPRPPAHYNCRSTIAPVMKSFEEIFHA